MKQAFARCFPVALGGPFLISGTYKLFHPGEATFAMMALDLPVWLSKSTIMAVTALELYLGFVLLLRKDLRWGLSLSTALMLAFTVFLWYLSTLAHPPACGCLGLTGMFRSTKQEAIFGLVRNCLILWGLKLSYDFYFKRTPNQPK